MLNTGDRVIIRSWSDMAEEYGTKATHNDVWIPFKPLEFTRDMAHLCGRTATIKDFEIDWIDDTTSYTRLVLTDWSDESGEMDWEILPEMVRIYWKIGHILDL